MKGRGGGGADTRRPGVVCFGAVLAGSGHGEVLLDVDGGADTG